MLPLPHHRLLSLLLGGLLACGPEVLAERGLENRAFLSERVLEDGAPRRLVAGTRLLLRFE